MYNPPLDAVFWGPFQEALSLRALTFNFQTQGYARQTHQSLEPLQKLVDFLRVNGNLQTVTVIVPEGWKTAAGVNMAPLLNLAKLSKDI